MNFRVPFLTETSSAWSTTRFMYSSKPCDPASPRDPLVSHAAVCAIGVQPQKGRTMMWPSIRMSSCSYSHTCTLDFCGKRRTQACVRV